MKYMFTIFAVLMNFAAMFAMFHGNADPMITVLFALVFSNLAIAWKDGEG